jgi:hypothetical protein
VRPSGSPKLLPASDDVDVLGSIRKAALGEGPGLAAVVSARGADILGPGSGMNDGGGDQGDDGDEGKGGGDALKFPMSMPKKMLCG